MSVADKVQAEFLHPVSLDRMALAYSKAQIERGPELVISTDAQRWSYAASLPLGVDPAWGAGLAVAARLRVLSGKVGVGILSADERSFVVEKEVTAKGDLAGSLVLPLPSPPVVGPLIVRNVSDSGPSKAVVEEVVICRRPPGPGAPETGASEPTLEELPLLVKSLEYLRPLVPYPGWSFDSDWHNPDFSFQTRRRLWEYCHARGWEIDVDLPWYGGLRVGLPLLSDAGRQLFVGGCIDPNELSFLGRILTADMVFVDVGAHTGLYSVYAAHRVARVCSFEPSRREFACLQHNLQRNNLRGARAFQLALGKEDGTAELHVAEARHSGHNTLRSFTYDGVVSERVEKVEVRSLDHFAAEHNLNRIDVLKIDVEQSELEVLQGAAGILRSMHPWLLLEVAQGKTAPAIARARESLNLLQNAGYVFYGIDPGTGLVAEASGDRLPENVIACSLRRPFPGDVLTASKYYFESSHAES